MRKNDREKPENSVLKRKILQKQNNVVLNEVQNLTFYRESDLVHQQMNEYHGSYGNGSDRLKEVVTAINKTFKTL